MNRPPAELSVHSECVPNISARGRTRRQNKGIVGLLVTAAVVALLAARHAPPLAYLVLFPLSGYVALLFLQVKEKT